jgi:hypothetical protein
MVQNTIIEKIMRQRLLQIRQANLYSSSFAFFLASISANPWLPLLYGVHGSFHMLTQLYVWYQKYQYVTCSTTKGQLHWKLSRGLENHTSYHILCNFRFLTWVVEFSTVIRRWRRYNSSLRPLFHWFSCSGSAPMRLFFTVSAVLLVFLASVSAFLSSAWL